MKNYRVTISFVVGLTVDDLARARMVAKRVVAEIKKFSAIHPSSIRVTDLYETIDVK